MVDFYILRIKRGYMSIDDVPLFWREKVRERITEE